MRRAAALSALVLAAPLALTACGGGQDLGPMPKVSGAFGKTPKVEIPKEKAGDQLQIKTLVEGKGREIKKNDLAIADYVGYTWNGKKSKQAASSYKAGSPAAFPVGQLVKGLDQGIIGQKVGSRVQLVIPPKDGYGAKGQPQAGIKAGDTLVFVVDLRADYGMDAGVKGKKAEDGGGDLPKVTDQGTGKKPKVEIPDSDPPGEFAEKTLIEGDGPKVKKGQLLVAKYVGKVWRSGAEDKKKPKPKKGAQNLKNGATFDSSWKAAQGRVAGQPTAFTIGKGQVVKGWDKGLVGKKVGSRVLLVLPPKLGYGKTGQPQVGIRPKDSLVFVVDILGTEGNPAKDKKGD